MNFEYKYPKLTNKRKLILSILENSPVPLCAYQIYDELMLSYNETSLSTIYRALDYFFEHSLTEKVDMPFSDEVYYLSIDKIHAHYAYCISCHNVIDIIGCPMDHYTPNLSDPDFDIISHSFVVFGYCKDCKR